MRAQGAPVTFVRCAIALERYGLTALTNRALKTVGYAQ